MLLNREAEQETIIIKITEINTEISQRNAEISELRADNSSVDAKIYSERKEIERLDLEHRDAVNVSHKNY